MKSLKSISAVVILAALCRSMIIGPSATAATVIFQFQDNYGRMTMPAASLTPVNIPVVQSHALVLSGMTTFRWPTNGLGVDSWGNTNFWGWTNGTLVLPLSAGGYLVQVQNWPRSWSLTVPNSTNTFYAADLSSNTLILGPQSVVNNYAAGILSNAIATSASGVSIVNGLIVISTNYDALGAAAAAQTAVQSQFNGLTNGFVDRSVTNAALNRLAQNDGGGLTGVSAATTASIVTGFQSNTLVLALTNTQSGASLNGGSVAITNQIYGLYDDTFRQETTNLLSPLGTPDWASQGFNAIASYHGSEVYLNEAQAAGNPAQECLFALPPGASGVTFSGNVRTLSGSTSGVYIGLDDNNNWYGRVNPTLTTSWTAFSCSMVSSDIIGSSSNLAAKILWTTTSALSVSNLQITFIGGGNVILNQVFKRYMVRPQNRLSEDGSPKYDNFDKAILNGWENINQSRAGTHSVLDFKTDANVIDIEVSAYANRPLENSWPLVIYENGILLTNLFPPNTPLLAHYLLPLGTSNVYNTVRIVSSFNFYNDGGNFCRAVIVPQTNHFAFLNNFPLKTVLLVGDSILADNNMTDGYQDVGHLIESYLPVRVINYCQGSGGLYNSWSESDQGIPEKTILCGVMASTHPDDIIIEHGINDLGNNSYGNGTNGYMADLADFVDTAHSYCPWATIYLQAIMGTNNYITHPTGGGGYTISQYWDAQRFVAQSRSSYCVFLNATNWMLPSDLQSDSIHPNQSGEVKYAWNLIQNLWTNRIVVTGESIKNTTNRWAGSFNGGFIFPATNTAPGSTTPKIWLPVTNNGAVYLIGGCQ